MSNRKALLAPLLGLALSACLGHQPDVGSGPIRLSEATQRNFEAYQRKRTPSFFAVAIDGNTSSYNTCKERGAACFKSSANRAIYHCEQLSRGTPCRIYAAEGRVVWQKEIQIAARP